MLSRALDSVRTQSLGEPECHVILGMPRIEAYNTALSVKADFVTWLDDDDYWTESHLQTMVETQQRENADVVYCRGVLRHPDGRETLFGNEPPTELPDYDFMYGGFMYRLDLLRALDGFPYTDANGSLHQKAWKLGAKFAFTGSTGPTLVVNYHGDNTGLTEEHYFEA